MSIMMLHSKIHINGIAPIKYSRLDMMSIEVRPSSSVGMGTAVSSSFGQTLHLFLLFFLPFIQGLFETQG